MKPILDRIAVGLRSEFRPTTPTEFFALRLAHRLGEPQAASHYALLAAQYPQEKLLATFQHTVALAQPGEDLGRQFHTALSAYGKNGTRTAAVRLAGIRVERRCVGATIFRDTHLEAVRVRQLPSDINQCISK